MYRLLVNTPRLGEDTGPPQDEVHPWGLAATQVRAGSRELLRHGIEDKRLIQAQIAPSKNTFWSFGEGGGGSLSPGHSSVVLHSLVLNLASRAKVQKSFVLRHACV